MRLINLLETHKWERKSTHRPQNKDRLKNDAATTYQAERKGEIPYYSEYIRYQHVFILKKSVSSPMKVSNRSLTFPPTDLPHWKIFLLRDKKKAYGT